MKKNILMCLLFLTLCQSHWVAAHAVITDYSLKITPIHVNDPAKVELRFNSQIELGLSQIFLVSKGDKHQLLQAVSGDKQGQIIAGARSNRGTDAWPARFLGRLLELQGDLQPR